MPPPGYVPPPNYTMYAPSPMETAMPSMPPKMAFIEGAAIPPGYRVATQPRVGLAVAGFTLFGSLYTASAITGGFVIDGGTSGGGALIAPVVGPFIAIGTAGGGGGVAVLLMFDGLGQSAGLAMAIAAFAAPSKYIVRSEYGSLTFGPIAVGAGTPGMGFHGDF